MITNLKELVDRTRIWAAEGPPELATETAIQQTGVSTEAIGLIESAFILVPRVYRRCIVDLQVKGINLGYFRLWPSSFSGRDLVADLIAANTSSENPFLQFLQDEKVIQVAVYDTDPIAIGSIARSGDEDVVYQIDTIDPWHPKLKRLARDFERFLLAVGNLMSISSTIREAADPRLLANELVECLRVLDFTEEEIGNWRPIAEVAFS